VSSEEVFKVDIRELLIKLKRVKLDGHIIQCSGVLFWLHIWQVGDIERFRLLSTCGVGRSSSRIFILKDFRVEV
jgi:hypothetical protein